METFSNSLMISTAMIQSRQWLALRETGLAGDGTTVRRGRICLTTVSGSRFLCLPAWQALWRRKKVADWHIYLPIVSKKYDAMIELPCLHNLNCQPDEYG